MTAGGGPGAGHDGERIWPQTFVLNGHQLRRLRQQHGLSQEKLADQAGISMTTVVRLERQARGRCRGRTLGRLARALGQHPAALTSDQRAGRRSAGVEFISGGR